MTKQLLVTTLLSFGIAALCTPVRAPWLDNPLIDKHTQKQLSDAHYEAQQGSHARAQALAAISMIPEILRVYIDTSNLSSLRLQASKDAVRDALQAWSDTGLLTILETDDADNADVCVRFRKTIHQGRHAGYLTAHRLARRQEGSIVVETNATIYVADRTPWGREMSFAHIRKTVMHEIGHLLGLEDANDPNLMMGPIAPYEYVRPVDLESIQALLLIEDFARSLLGDTPKTPYLQNGYVPTVFTFAEPR